jgi:hypothetical protein
MATSEGVHALDECQLELGRDGSVALGRAVLDDDAARRRSET